MKDTKEQMIEKNMKTELEIAKGLLDRREYIIKLDKIDLVEKCEQHKATCERWLEYIEDTETYYSDVEKKKDLKQTIALYEENEI